jgi:hypothetical protein
MIRYTDKIIHENYNNKEIKYLSFFEEFDENSFSLLIDIQDKKIYKFDISELNILYINTNKEFIKFYNDYSNGKNQIDEIKLLLDYDGYEINKKVIKKYDKDKKYWKILFRSDYTFGYIYKNYDKIKTKKIDLSILITNKETKYYLEKIDMKDIKENKGFYHFSPYPITVKELKEKKLYNAYNPEAFWYSVNFDFQKKFFIFSLRRYVYKLDLSNLNIKVINNYETLIEFSKIYQEKSRINWNKVKKDYDGVQINKKTLRDFFNKDYNENNHNEEGSYLGDWIEGWGAASGVILKNYNNLKMKKIDLKIIISNNKKKFYF